MKKSKSSPSELARAEDSDEEKEIDSYQALSVQVSIGCLYSRLCMMHKHHSVCTQAWGLQR